MHQLERYNEIISNKKALLTKRISCILFLILDKVLVGDKVTKKQKSSKRKQKTREESYTFSLAQA